jgi:Ribosomal RNA-processing protein 7 (RRP7) C-terminal domain
MEAWWQFAACCECRSQQAKKPDSRVILQIQLHPRKTSAVVVFRGKEGTKSALSVASKGSVVQAQALKAADEHAVGLRAYVEEHKSLYPGNEQLSRELDAWMEAFEEEEERKRQAAEQADDGWTVVTRKPGRKRKQGDLSRHSRYNPNAWSGERMHLCYTMRSASSWMCAGQTVSGGVSLAAAQEHAAKKKPKQATDFYRFQAREQKRNELLELRKEFADAKKQLQVIRATRKPIG